MVPSISLQTAIGLVGDVPVALLKLDAQGADFSLLHALPPGLLRSRVNTVRIEVRSSTCPQLYAGAVGCEEVVAHFQSEGFHPGSACPPGLNKQGVCVDEKRRGGTYGKYSCCESDIYFCSERPMPKGVPVASCQPAVNQSSHR